MYGGWLERVPPTADVGILTGSRFDGFTEATPNDSPRRYRDAWRRDRLF